MHQGRQNLGEALGREQTFGEVIDHHGVQGIHGDGTSLAERLSDAGGSGTGVVAIEPSSFRGAGAQGHCTIARRAGGKAGEQNGSGRDARRGGLGIACRQSLLDAFEFHAVDDCRNRDGDLLGLRLLTQSFGIPAIEGPLADVDPIGQDAMERADTEACPASGAITAFIQPTDQSLGAEWPRLAIAAEVELENELNRLLLNRINIEFLFDARTALFYLHRAIAQGDGASIIKALDSVFLHGPQDMFGVFARLIFVKKCDNLAHHHLGGVIAEFLGDRDQPNARFGEFADIHFQAKGIPKKPRIGMHDDDIERIVIIEGALNHALKFGALIIGCGGAWFNILRPQIHGARGAECGDLFALVRDGKVALRLPPGRDAKVAASAQYGDLPKVFASFLDMKVYRKSP